MPRWSRLRNAHAEATSDLTATLGAMEGQPCTRGQCLATNAAACEYVDRRSRDCPTAWCPAHGMSVEGKNYCRRHGGVIEAVNAAGGGFVALPDISTRAPSLVRFVGLAVGPALGHAMHEAWPGDLSLSVTSVRLSSFGNERDRSWSQKWALYSNRGDEVAVTLAVGENRDDLVMVRVDTETVAALVPPWITRRSYDDDEPGRQAFYRSVIEAARAGVEDAYAREASLKLFA